MNRNPKNSSTKIRFISLKRIIELINNYGLFLLLKKSLRLFVTEGLVGIKRKIDQGNTYNLWVQENSISEDDLSRIVLEIEEFNSKPLLSIIVPVYNIKAKYLRECLDSVINQLYQNWELCIADDASTIPDVKDTLEEYRQKDIRIKVVYRKVNGHISAASNSALELATGEYIALLDHDDVLAVEALYEVVKLLNRNRQADMIYTDEDKIDENGWRHQPFFKPDWSPDLLLSQMYTCHLGVYRKTLIDKIGGFREGFEGSQDYDLVLRLTEKTKQIFHIPKVLYHWRSFSESAAMDSCAKNYAFTAGLQALNDALERRGNRAEATMVKKQPGCYRVRYLLQQDPKVSIIIPTRDQPKLLSKCIKSIVKNSKYANHEIIVVDNGSVNPKALFLFEKLAGEYTDKVTIVRMDMPFNFSVLNNKAVEVAEGKVLLFLNDDTEVITDGWLEDMVAQATRASIGAIGAKLFYADGHIQHSGIIMGIVDIAGHGHRFFKKGSGGYSRRLLVNANYSAVTGACLMVEKDKFIEVGGFDEELAQAYNDVDLCLKLFEKGYYNIVLPDVQLIHHESKTRGYEDSEVKQQRFRREAAIMKKRWAKYIANDPFYNPNLTRAREDFSVRV